MARREDFESIVVHEAQHVKDYCNGLLEDPSASPRYQDGPFSEPFHELRAYNTQLEFMLENDVSKPLLRKIAWQSNFVERQVRLTLANHFMNVEYAEQMALELQEGESIRCILGSVSPPICTRFKDHSVERGGHSLG